MTVVTLETCAPELGSGRPLELELEGLMCTRDEHRVSTCITSQPTHRFGPFDKVTVTVDAPPDPLSVLVKTTGGGADVGANEGDCSV